MGQSGCQGKGRICQCLGNYRQSSIIYCACLALKQHRLKILIKSYPDPKHSLQLHHNSLKLQTQDLIEVFIWELKLSLISVTLNKSIFHQDLPHFRFAEQGIRKPHQAFGDKDWKGIAFSPTEKTISKTPIIFKTK